MNRPLLLSIETATQRLAQTLATFSHTYTAAIDLSEAVRHELECHIQGDLFRAFTSSGLDEIFESLRTPTDVREIIRQDLNRDLDYLVRNTLGVVDAYYHYYFQWVDPYTAQVAKLDQLSPEPLRVE